MANVVASVSIHLQGKVPNSATVYHHAHVGMLIGMHVPNFATLLGRIGLRASSSVVRSSAHVLISTHMQLPVPGGYAVDSVRLGRVILAKATVLHGARVSINPTVHVSSVGIRDLVGAKSTMALRGRVTALGQLLRRTTIRAGGGVGIVGHARVVESGVDVIRTRLGMVARAFPHYAVQAKIGMAAKVKATGNVPIGVRVCHIGTRSTVSAKASIAAESSEHVQAGMRMVATPHVSRRTPVHIMTGLSGRLSPRNLIGGHVGLGIAGHVSPSEGRGSYGQARIGTKIGISAHATCRVKATAAVWTGISMVAKDRVLMGGHLTVKAALGVVVNIVKSARGVVHVQAGTTTQAAGERNSLGGITSTITPTNPKGMVTRLDPISTISVIPS